MRGPIDRNLAKRLGEVRRYMRMTLADLEQASGIKKSTIHRYETGKIHIPVERHIELAKALHCDRQCLEMPPGSPMPKIRFRPKTTTHNAELIRFLARYSGEGHRDDASC